MPRASPVWVRVPQRPPLLQDFDHTTGKAGDQEQAHRWLLERAYLRRFDFAVRTTPPGALDPLGLGVPDFADELRASRGRGIRDGEVPLRQAPLRGEMKARLLHRASVVGAVQHMVGQLRIPEALQGKEAAPVADRQL